MSSKTIREIADFLIKNDGPVVDSSGKSKAHPTKTGLKCCDLEYAIKLAEQEGLSKGIKPWHISKAKNVWENSEYVEEVIFGKMTQLLHEKYHGSLVELINKMDQDALHGPLIEVVNGKRIQVSTKVVTNRHMGSIPQRVLQYIELNGLQERFAELRPYHFSKSPAGTYDDENMLNEVVSKKIEQLLREKYDGNLANLISNVSVRELKQPLIDTLAGENLEVSMGLVVAKFRSSPFEIVKRYIELNGLEERYSNLQPYHFAKASQGVYNNPANIDEVLCKKIDQLLKECYGGNLVGLISNTTSREINSPFFDTLDGQKIEVSMTKVAQFFKGNPFDMVSKYIEVKGLQERFSSLRPYHFAKSGRNIFDREDIIDEVLTKKIKQLLSQDYDGDFIRLALNLNQDELLRPLVEVVDGIEVKVSMKSVLNRFRCSPAEMLWRYMEIEKIQGQFPDLRPYHLPRAPRGTVDDPKVADEILVKKIDSLLKDKYGNIKKLMCYFDMAEMIAPFDEEVYGHTARVSTMQVANQFRRNAFDMLKRYFEVKNRPFKYTRICCIGSPEVRRRRINGEFTGYDLYKIQSQDKLDTSRYGYRAFDSKDKDVTREIMTETYMDILEDTQVAYLGLESERFSSLRWFAEYLNYDASSSTVIERDKRVYNAMKATQEYATNGLKNVLNGLEIRLGDFDEEINRLDKRYNLINLDYCGDYSKTKEKAIATLFRRKLLQDDALLFITLDDSPIGRWRSKARGYDDQVKSATKSVLESAFANRYMAKPELSLSYKGGTNGKSRDMILLGFSITRCQ